MVFTQTFVDNQYYFVEEAELKYFIIQYLYSLIEISYFQLLRDILSIMHICILFHSFITFESLIY